MYQHLALKFHSTYISAALWVIKFFLTGIPIPYKGVLTIASNFKTTSDTINFIFYSWLINKATILTSSQIHLQNLYLLLTILTLNTALKQKCILPCTHLQNEILYQHITFQQLKEYVL